MIHQSAGDIAIEVYTDGSPVWPTLRISDNRGEGHEIRLSVAHLHDLAYCIQRVLAQLEPRR